MPDPFDTKMVFFRVGWMDEYQGVNNSDKIARGGSFVEEHGFGYEAFNYQPFEGHVYGWVMPGRRKKGVELEVNLPSEAFAKVNLRRIGGTTSDRSLERVTVVWVSTHPHGRAYVVGWYKNATVFLQPQDAPSGSRREYDGMPVGFVTCAKATDAVLIPVDERVIQVPQGGKGKFGQSNMWYADDRSNPLHKALRQTVLDAINDQGLPESERRSPRPTPRQHDVLKRQRVETAAIEMVTQHYTKLGYEVRSVERDNVGWDLEATLDKRKLRLEVKGLSGSELAAELTPNEYAKMNEHQDTFRLCIVTTALVNPTLAIFQFSSESGRWEFDGQVLTINEVISARCSVNRLDVK